MKDHSSIHSTIRVSKSIHPIDHVLGKYISNIKLLSIKTLLDKFLCKGIEFLLQTLIFLNPIPLQPGVVGRPLIFQTSVRSKCLSLKYQKSCYKRKILICGKN